jgi:hypothetical protein
VTDQETIAYYDAMLQENTERNREDLPPTAEYKRLSDMVDAITAQLKEQGVAPDDETLMAVPKEVADFMEAIDRYDARRRPVM